VKINKATWKTRVQLINELYLSFSIAYHGADFVRKSAHRYYRFVNWEITRDTIKGSINAR